MASYVGRNERQRELEKLYNRMCGRYSRYEVWQDMVVMIACAIANAVDKRHFDEREAMYMRIVPKYSKEELDIFQVFFTHIVMGMEEKPDCDFLGELYMWLELGNSKAGQFFTPYDVCRAMAEVTIDADFLKAQIEEHGWISINDCACGAGATLIAAANILRCKGLNYQQQALFVAQDVDMTVGLMCYIQLSLLGCAGYVVIGNTLTEPQVGPVLFGEESPRCWYTPMFFHPVWVTRRAIAMAKGVFQAIAPSEERLRAKGIGCPGPKPATERSDRGGATVATAFPAAAEAQTIADIGETTGGECVPEGAVSESMPDEAEQMPAEAYQPTFTVSTKKKNEGQIMFDFS